jgi:hypothetical protein
MFQGLPCKNTYIYHPSADGLVPQRVGLIEDSIHRFVKEWEQVESALEKNFHALLQD